MPWSRCPPGMTGWASLPSHQHGTAAVVRYRPWPPWCVPVVALWLACPGPSTGDAGLSDGGSPSCTSSTRPRLVCLPPRTVATGDFYELALLAPIDGGLVAGWTDHLGTRFQLVLLREDGGSEVLISDEAGQRIHYASLAAEGDAWAAAYTPIYNSPIQCFSSRDRGRVTSGKSSPFARNVGVAVSEQGAVALISGGLDYSAGETSAGCPSSLTEWFQPLDGDSVAVVHKPGTGRDGFRYVTGQSSSCTTESITLFVLPKDGGVTMNSGYAQNRCVNDVGAVMSSDGREVLIPFGMRPVGVGQDGIGALAAPFDLTPFFTRQPVTVLADETNHHVSAACGPGCLAHAWTPSGNSVGPVSIIFTSDTPDFARRTTADAGWDVTCETNNGARVAVAYQGGRLHVLVSEREVLLYVCDLPPL